MQTESKMNDKRAVLASRHKRRKFSMENVTTATIGNCSTSKRMKITYSDSEHEDENDFVSVRVEPGRSAAIVTLIDRVIDFGRYKPDASLYSLCREWSQATEKLSAEAERAPPPPVRALVQETVGCESAGVTELPSPDRPQDDLAQEILKLNDAIKTKTRSTEKSDLDLIKVLNVDEATEIHALLKLHVNRWKSARREWLRFYESTNARYKETREKLQTIFEGI